MNTPFLVGSSEFNLCVWKKKKKKERLTEKGLKFKFSRTKTRTEQNKNTKTIEEKKKINKNRNYNESSVFGINPNNCSECECVSLFPIRARVCAYDSLLIGVLWVYNNNNNHNNNYYWPIQR